MWNIARVLESFGDKETEQLWHGQRTRLPADLLLRATVNSTSKAGMT